MSETDIPKLPPEAEQILNDPRLEGMADPLPGFPPEERLLLPANPPAVGDSRFLLMCESSGAGAGGQVTWVNEPKDPAYIDRVGYGRGLAQLPDRPRLEERRKKPRKMPEVWSYLTWLVASPRVADVLTRFDRSVIDTVKIDWIFSDGQQLDGYVFLDVRRLVYAYDYRRTAVLVRRERGRKYLDRLAFPRALKEIPDPGVHVFRDAYHRPDIFMSRDLAKELSSARDRSIFFRDPASAAAVRLD
jgi:hypothetical protein